MRGRKGLAKDMFGMQLNCGMVREISSKIIMMPSFKLPALHWYKELLNDIAGTLLV